MWNWLLFLGCAGVFGSHLVQEPLDECQSFNRPLRVGVQHEESAEYAAARWNDTIAVYLTNFANVRSVGPRRSVQQSGDTARRQLGGERLVGYATSEPRTASWHGVGCTRGRAGAAQERPHVSERLDRLSLPAAQGLKLCVVRRDSFSGYQIQDLEALQQVGVHLADVFNVTYSHSHDQVLEDVASGRCALGAVGTSHLQRVASTGLIHPPYSVLALDMWTEVGRVNTDMFPLLHSTRLYPEWGWAALVDHVPFRLAELVRIGLMAMGGEHPAAVQGEHAGFTFPADYHQAKIVEYHLDFFGDGAAPPRKFKADDVGMCEECPVRYYSNVTGATACQACAEGYSSYQDGATECELEDNTGYIPIKSCNNYPNNTLVVGVLTVLDKGLVYERCHPTFETLLNDFLSKFGCFVRMVEPNWSEMPTAVAQGTIDFAFLDPGMYIRLEHQYGLDAKGSVLRNYQGAVTGYLGGIIFRAANRNLDLNSLEDVLVASQSRSLKACPVNQNSFSGWSIQHYEFFKQHIDVMAVFDEIIFLENHDESVAMVAR
eukprot:g17112.t1